MAVEYPQQETASDNFWQDYGPPILGAIIILALLVGGWYFWRARTTQQSQEVAQVQQEEASPSPTPAEGDQEEGEATQAAEAPEAEIEIPEEPKGGPQEAPATLPATGFPQAAVGLVSLLALVAGWKLRRIR